MLLKGPGVSQVWQHPASCRGILQRAGIGISSTGTVLQQLGHCANESLQILQIKVQICSTRKYIGNLAISKRCRTR